MSSDLKHLIFYNFQKIQNIWLKKLYFNSSLPVLGILGLKELTDKSFGSTISCEHLTFDQTYEPVPVSQPTHKKLSQSMEFYPIECYPLEICCSVTPAELTNLIQLPKLWCLEFKISEGTHSFHTAVMAKDVRQTGFLTDVGDSGVP